MREMLLNEGLTVCSTRWIWTGWTALLTSSLNRPFAECLTPDPKPEDWQTPLQRMKAMGKTEAVRVLLEHGARAEP